MNSRFSCCLVIIISLAIGSCNSHRGASNTTDCIGFLNSISISLDTLKEINEYVEDVTNQFSGLKQKDLEKSFMNCTKPEIMKYYLNMHPQIDSVIITPSGHGISFYRSDEGVWSNIIIE